MSYSNEKLKELAEKDWYYNIEVGPGIVTNGRPRVNAAVYREFLRRIGLAGKTCLDIGTQEFVSPVVLLRQGARSVTAYDRLALTERFDLIRHAYDVDFDYINGIPLQDLKKTLTDGKKKSIFDVVNFSGVLYHMIDPLAGLAMARSFVRTNGLLIIETSVSREDSYSLIFNNAGSIYPGSNYFQVSVKTLDYWIRMLRLRALDCAWWGNPEISRFVVICRAVDGVLPERDDKWMTKGFVREDFRPYGLDFNELRSKEPAVGYERSDTFDPVFHPDTDVIDLHGTCQKLAPYKHDPRLVELKLDHRY